MVECRRTGELTKQAGRHTKGFQLTVANLSLSTAAPLNRRSPLWLGRLRPMASPSSGPTTVLSALLAVWEIRARASQRGNNCNLDMLRMTSRLLATVPRVMAGPVRHQQTAAAAATGPIAAQQTAAEHARPIARGIVFGAPCCRCILAWYATGSSGTAASFCLATLQPLVLPSSSVSLQTWMALSRKRLLILQTCGVAWPQWQAWTAWTVRGRGADGNRWWQQGCRASDSGHPAGSECRDLVNAPVPWTNALLRSPAGDILDVIASWAPEQQRAAHAAIAEVEAQALRDMQLMPGVLELSGFLDALDVPRALVTRNVNGGPAYPGGRSR